MIGTPKRRRARSTAKVSKSTKSALIASGLSDKFEYQAPAGTTFFYNTPVYAVTKRILTAAAKRALEAITREWLTVPTGMKDTAWRARPAAPTDVGNSSGLVTSPRDIARFGAMILNNGVSESGTRVVSANGVAAMLTPSPVNPAYGRLWWRNVTFLGSPVSSRHQRRL